MMYNQDKQIQDMLNEIEEKGISVYESEYGFGYTYCDADIYLTFEQALIAAYYLTTGKLCVTMTVTKNKANQVENEKNSEKTKETVKSMIE